MNMKGSDRYMKGTQIQGNRKAFGTIGWEHERKTERQ